MVKTLDKIKSEYWKNNSKPFFSYLKKEISEGLELTDAEIHYLLVCFGETDVTLDVIRDNSEATSFVKAITFPNDDNPDIDTYNLITREVLAILSDSRLDDEIVYVDYGLPIDESIMKEILEQNKDKVIITSAYVSYHDFPVSRYYCTELRYVPMAERKNKSNLPLLKLLGIISDMLETFGFVSLKEYYPFHTHIPFIYPNDKGQKIIAYLDQTAK